MADVRALVQEYLLFAATETDKKGNRRAATTMNSYRRSLEGFAAAVEQSGLELAELPESFLEREWMATQQSVVSQPIQLRVRAGAIKQFTQWLFRNSIPCAPMRHPVIQTPPPKPKVKKETQMSDVTYLGDASMQADPIPSTQSAPQPQYALYTPPPPPQAAAPVPPPAPRAPPPKPAAPRATNPLAAMLPSGQYKLRVRREREIDDPVWVGDFPADRVAAAGAVEPFLGREVTPRLAAQGITGDVTFLVSPVAPDGKEGERARITVACVPAMAAPVTSVPAPVMGAVAPASMAHNEMAEMLAFHRRAQEELEERLAKKFDTQKEAAPKPQPVEERRPSVANEEMDELRRMVGQLAGTVRSLSERLEEREFMRRDMEMAPPPPPAQPPAPQLDILGVIREVTAMTKAQTPAQPQQAMGLAEVFNIMAQAKQVFQPQNVNIDVSPLEERLEDMQRRMDAQAKSKSRTMEMLEEFKAMKEVFNLVGGGESAPKPTNGLGNALGSLVTRVLDNPAPLAEAVERILTATAQVKAAQTGAAPVQRAAPPSQPQIPPQVVKATNALLDAETAETTVLAAHEWLTLMTQVPALQKAAQRITALLRDEKATELTIYFRQVFAHLGMGEKATPARVTKLVEDILAKVHEANTAENDEEGDVDDDAPPDLTIRVGGVQHEARAEDESEEVEEDESEASEDESEDESDEQMEASDEGEDAALEEAAIENGESNSIDLDDVSRDELAEMLNEEAQPAAESKPRRKRRTKAEMAAARAAEAAAQSQQQSSVEALS